MFTMAWCCQSPISEDRMTGVRWIVVALLFFATVINYVDRSVLGVLKPVLEKELGWDQVDYGWIVTAFQVTYAAGYALGGRLIDRIGVRLGYFLAVTVWSVAEIAHAFVRSVSGFSLARAGLGIAEGGNFPGRDQDGHGVVPEDSSAPSPPACSTRAATSARCFVRW